MNDRNFDQLLDAWMDLGPSVAPQRVADAARLEARSTRQTPVALSRWAPRRFPVMSQSIRIALASAAIVGVAAIGFGLLDLQNVGGPAPTPLSVATPGALPSAGSLEPGTYVIVNPYADEDPIRSCELGCSDYQSIMFTLPAGWATADGLIYKHLNEPTEVAFSVWTPGDIYLDPCRWDTSGVFSNPSEHIDDANGEIVLDSQYPLLNQVGREAAAPTNVTLGGQRAMRIELSMSADIDIAGCDQGQFRSWTEWDVPDGANSHHAPGQVDVVYFVDVDRRVLFIDASHMPAASEADLAELEAILDSMFIDRGGSPPPLPADSVPHSETLRNRTVSTPVEFSLPADDQLELVPSTFPWLIEINHASDSWGIKLADVTGATNHADRFGGEAIPASDAATFLDALDALASYAVSDVGTASIGGRSVLVATISLEEGVENDHLDVDGQGGLGFDTPNVTYLTDVDGAIVLVQDWARTEGALAANRLLADSILASLRFLP